MIKRWMPVTSLCSVVLWLAATPAPADVRQEVAVDADFLRGLQLPDGAIVSDVTARQVEPYVANYAAWGLARAARFTGDAGYLEAALRWLSWYQDHMGPDGIVHDYVVVDGIPEVTDDEDSVDATSGVFLLATREAYLAADRSSRPELLGRFRSGISRAVSAIESLRDGDGLTWAKSSWRVKYLMDNAEAYGGLLAAAELARALGDAPLAWSANEGSRRARSGVARLWNAEREAYDWAEHENGDRQPTDWTVLYPDAVEQAWAVAFGVVEPLRARGLMTRFLQAQPGWDRPTGTSTYWDGAPYRHGTGFWPIAGLALQRVGESTRAAAAAAHIRQGALEIDRRPPFTTGSQGQLILLSTGGVTRGPLREPGLGVGAVLARLPAPGERPR